MDKLHNFLQEEIVVNNDDIKEFIFDLNEFSIHHCERERGNDVSNKLLHFTIQKNAKLNLKILGSGEFRVELNLVLDIVGGGAIVFVNGALLLTKNSNVKINVLQNHLVSNSNSVVVIKTVLQDQTKFDYRGTIFIDEKAAQTVANQENKNIVMSPDVVVTSVPNIEVLNEDVQCGHGSAIGKLDQDQILYLMSRGLSKDAANEILLKSFLEIND